MTAGLWHRWTHPAQGEDLLSPPTLHLGGDAMMRSVAAIPSPAQWVSSNGWKTGCRVPTLMYQGRSSWQE